jgi:hypothetical protein
MSFEIKYKPKKIDEIVGNNCILLKMEEWITKYDITTKFLLDNNLLKEKTKGRKKKLNSVSVDEIEMSKKKGSLIIIGPHGCGKSVSINMICEKLNCKIINFNDYQFEEFNIALLKKIIKPDYFFEEEYQNKILLIDGYEKIISKKIKKEILNLVKYNNFHRLIPFIIVSNNKHSSCLSTLKKSVNIIEMYSLNNDNIKKIMNNICYNEEININNKLYDMIIKNCKYDIRKIMFNLEILKIIHNEDIINIEKLENLNEIIKNKNYTNELFGIVFSLIITEKKPNEYIELFKIHKSILSLMLYENYYNYCSGINNYYNIINNFKLGDLIENYIHSEQNWNLNSLHCFSSCSIPAYYISNNYNGNKNKTVYPIDLNKTTIKKKKNKKNDKIINNENIYYYNNKSIEELIFFNDILY